MPSLTKKAGRYYAQFYDSARSPKRKTLSLGVARKRDAEKVLRKIERDHALGTFDPWTDDPKNYDRDAAEMKPLTLAEARTRFLAAKADLKPKTTATYAYLTERALRGVSHRLAANAGDLVDHFERWVRDSEVSKATQHKRQGHLRVFFKWCVREGILSASPLEQVETVSKPQKTPKAVREDQLRAACDALTEAQAWRGDFWRLMFYAGLRPRDAAMLRVGDADVERAELTLKTQKNGVEGEVVPLTEAALEAVKRSLSRLADAAGGSVLPPDALLFVGRPECVTERNTTAFIGNMSAAWRKVRKAANLPSHLAQYGLRHGFCTRLAENGVSAPLIQKAARHQDVATTMKYIHLTKGDVRAMLEASF